MQAVTAEQMRRVEDRWVQHGTSLDTLMRRAGIAVAQSVDDVEGTGQVLILVGPGNNGGDGLVAANRLVSQGHSVTVYTFRRKCLSPFKGTVIAAEGDGGLAQLRDLLSTCTVVVDGLLGIGQTRPVEGLLASVLLACDETRSPLGWRVAIDIPTGVHSDTGAVPGPAFRADLTLCMGHIKRGTVLFPGAAFAGQVRVVDMGMPDHPEDDTGVNVPDTVDIARMLPTRRENSNKGTYGRVLIVAGSHDFLGAPTLTAIAALRAGTGLAEVASIPTVLRSVATHAPEPVYLTLPEHEGRISLDAIKPIKAALTRTSSVVYGPGLGVSDAMVQFANQVLNLLSQAQMPPAVIDADGLNALAKIERWWRCKARLILTPHPGEMSRLTGLSIAEIQTNRLDVALEHAVKWEKTVVLKGAGTIVADPSGRATINSTGSANLATGGTGDVLSGIIGGLLAQGCDTWDAAVAGTYLHGTAGDMVAGELGLAGTIAGDLFVKIPRARQAILREAEAVDR